MKVNSYYSGNNRTVVDSINEFCKFAPYLNNRGMNFLLGFLDSGCYNTSTDTFEENNKQTALELLHFLQLVSIDGVNLINNNLSYEEIKDEIEKLIINLTEENYYVFRLNGSLFTFDKENKLTLIPAEESNIIKQA